MKQPRNLKLYARPAFLIYAGLLSGAFAWAIYGSFFVEAPNFAGVPLVLLTFPMGLLPFLFIDGQGPVIFVVSLGGMSIAGLLQFLGLLWVLQRKNRDDTGLVADTPT